ncbi:hypothetical protein [Streptomyces sp. NPDC047928]|uniref:hypothetical protein n=1 Tax=unclassified Streptomyces TaxID=2593676 RepID=UPI0037109D0A
MVHKTLGRHPRTAALAVAAVLVLVPLAGCGDGDGNGDTEPTSSPLPTATGTPAPTMTANAPADQAEAREEIEENWATFFDPQASIDDKAEVLENGEQLRPVLTAFSQDPNAAKTSVKIKDVAFTSADKADVTYDLLVGGTPALPDSKGTSVLQDDTWKVSQKTLCALVKLSGNATPMPGC